MSLVSGLFDDARHAVGARVDVIRKDLNERLETVTTRLTSMLTAMAIITVTATFCGLAITATLVAGGVPLWVALWGVTLTALVIGVGARRRANAAPGLALDGRAVDAVDAVVAGFAAS